MSTVSLFLETVKYKIRYQRERFYYFSEVEDLWEYVTRCLEVSRVKR